MRFIGRFSGVISYSDGSQDQFAYHLDEKGNVSVHSGIRNTPNNSNQAILEVQTSNDWLENMLTLVSDTLTLSPQGKSIKIVTGASMHISGRVAHDDNT